MAHHGDDNYLGAHFASGRHAATLHGRVWREVYQLMVGCFDASGHESDQPFLVVAGFVSSAGDWDEFSVAWMDRLRKDELPYFHASQYASSSGIFAGWREQEARRRKLASDLMELIERYTFRYFVQGIRPADFQRSFSEEQQSEFKINAYALCGRSCVADLGRWLRGDKLHWNDVRVPDLVFEKGDIGRGKLCDMLVRHQYPEPSFRPGKKPQQTKIGVEQPFVPLQAADWLAYESFQLLKLGSPDREQWRWPMRQFFNRLRGVPCFWVANTLDRVKGDLAELDNQNFARVVIADSDDAERFT